MNYFSYFAPLSHSETLFLKESILPTDGAEIFLVNQDMNKWELRAYKRLICSELGLEHTDNLNVIEVEDFQATVLKEGDAINAELLAILSELDIEAVLIHRNNLNSELDGLLFEAHHVFDDIDDAVAKYITQNEMFGIDKQIRLVFNALSYERFKHTMRVVFRMMQLVVRYEELEPQYAYFAALFHDYAKEMDINEQKTYVEEYFPIYADVPPAAYHGFAAAIELSQMDDELDDNIFEAIAFHTVGIPQWNPLGLALFIADYCEFGRGHQKEWQLVWEKAQESLELGAMERIIQTDAYFKKTGKDAYWTTENMLQWLTEEQK